MHARVRAPGVGSCRVPPSAEAAGLSKPSRLLLPALLVLGLSGCGEVLLVGNTLVGCGARGALDLQPDTLPPGQLGQPYHADLSVGAPASVHGFYVADAHPLPPGLRIEHLHGERVATLVGTPTRAGLYEVHLSVGTHGTQCVGRRAERRYLFEIGAE